jgi:hypothetical protein
MNTTEKALRTALLECADFIGSLLDMKENAAATDSLTNNGEDVELRAREALALLPDACVANTCDDCGADCGKTGMSCPDGAYICKRCFDAGHH